MDLQVPSSPDVFNTHEEPSVNNKTTRFNTDTNIVVRMHVTRYEHSRIIFYQFIFMLGNRNKNLEYFDYVRMKK